MSVSANEVYLILQSRYDYQSARTILGDAAKHAGIKSAGPFDAETLIKLADSVLAVGSGVATASDTLRTLAKPAAAPAPQKKAAPQPAAPQKQVPASHGGPKKGPPPGKRPGGKQPGGKKPAPKKG